MTDIDTSPAALRELADWFNDDLAADVDPQYPPAVEAVLCEVEDRFARIVSVLRAIAAEKEAATANPLGGAIERGAMAIAAAQGRSWGAADATVQDRWRELATAVLSTADAEAGATVKPDLTVGASDQDALIHTLRANLAGAEQERDAARSALRSALAARFDAADGDWNHAAADRRDRIAKIVEAAIAPAIARAEEAEARAERMRAALEWYGENARLARLIHIEGDKGRHAIADDGGKRARAALSEQEAGRG
ncbi:hypothetical protein [Prosthecomicrobium hirschii]|uniref:hypothetical protein n=1 Tax=Prosthecodimorpha hirschii TaxID=665126 RepID=UPI00221FE714|nr:hypothetical protein [Prosthecomicrobium hirschii]MCW1844197.1 hypothetical protein [Prosthecomicrobium hirschii]